MEKIVFALIGLLLPIFVGMWFYDFFNSEGMNNMVAPIFLLVSGAPLIAIFVLPVLVWAIIASIYGVKNKPVVKAYTIGMIAGIILAFTIIPNLDIIKTYF